MFRPAKSDSPLTKAFNKRARRAHEEKDGTRSRGIYS